MTYGEHVDSLIALAKEAGGIIMEYYQGDIDVTIKEDDSPVTAADIAANDVIVSRLRSLTPTIPVVSEELGVEDNRAAIETGMYWLVDPLDGTKSFIKRTGEFTVNIALIEDGKPTGGVVFVPALKELYYVGAQGYAYREVGGETTRIQVRKIPKEGIVAVASKSHATQETEDFIESLGCVTERISVASSLKFCRVAEGSADIYPRFGRTMYWDTGAGHAVLNAAGGGVVTADKMPFTYHDKEGDFANPYFIAFSNLSLL